MRVPPHSIEAEQAVLGICLQKMGAVSYCLSKLSTEQFYKELHQQIFSAIASLVMDGEAVDMVTVLDRIGGDKTKTGAYIIGLSNTIPSMAVLESSCRIIEEKHRRRTAISLAADLIDQCYENPDLDYSLNAFGGKFWSVAAGEKNAGAQDIYSIAQEVLEEVKDRSENGMPPGLQTGFYDLDKLVLGFCPTDLIIVAARPSMGKTALAMQFGQKFAAEGKSVLVFSLEMGKAQLAYRVLASESGVLLKALRKGLMNDQTWPMLTAAIGRLHNSKIIIDDTPALTITQMQSRSLMHHAKNKIDAIIVDYLQLARGDGDNRTLEIGSITRGLKSIAKQLNVPVIALSQLNRSLESRTDKRPMMADLRESGAIEQDADIITFIYRDEMYNKNEDNPLKGIAEVIVAKNRNGETGSVKLGYDGRFVKFHNIETRFE